MSHQNSKILLTVIGIVCFALLVIFSSFYSYWTYAPADKTCVKCHEIRCAAHELENSSHRDLSCKECHGTALSHGFRSLREKTGMIVHHFRKFNTEDIRLSETQILELMDNCQRCHSVEYAGWASGKHAATYSEVFLDSLHNSTEQLNYDCLRCHGMFYDGTISDLVEPLSTTGPWELKNARQGNLPTMPCSACHMIHTEGYPVGNIPDSIRDSSEYNAGRAGLGFFDRAEKTHYTMGSLPKLKLSPKDSLTVISDDLAMRNCVQCHAPNSRHEAGTGDDRTPRGVHAGLSCLACHDPHTNDARNSCTRCHPAVSNCNLDVRKMDTTYLNPDSPNNIHFVSCSDCHDDR